MTRWEETGFCGAWAAVKVFACPTESSATGGIFGNIPKGCEEARPAVPMAARLQTQLPWKGSESGLRCFSLSFRRNRVCEVRVLERVLSGTTV